MGLCASVKKPLSILLTFAIVFFSLAVTSAEVQAAAGGFVTEQPRQNAVPAQTKPWYQHLWEAVKWVGTAYLTVAAGAKIINAISSGSLYRGLLTALGMGPDIEPLSARKLDLAELQHIRAELIRAGRIGEDVTLQELLNDVFILADGSVLTRAEMERQGIVYDGKGGFTFAPPRQPATTQTQTQTQVEELQEQPMPDLGSGWYKRYELVLISRPTSMFTGDQSFAYTYDLYENLYYAGQLMERTRINRNDGRLMDFPWESLDEKDYGCNVTVTLEIPYYASRTDTVPLGTYKVDMEFEYIGPANASLGTGGNYCKSVNPQVSGEADPQQIGNAARPTRQPTVTQQQSNTQPNTQPKQQSTQPTQTKNTPSASVEYIEYVIQPGDNLSKIAGKYGVGVNELRDLNNIADPNKIYAGQVIRIPKKSNPNIPAPDQPS